MFPDEPVDCPRGRRVPVFRKSFRKLAPVRIRETKFPEMQLQRPFSMQFCDTPTPVLDSEQVFPNDAGFASVQRP